MDLLDNLVAWLATSEGGFFILTALIGTSALYLHLRVVFWPTVTFAAAILVLVFYLRRSSGFGGPDRSSVPQEPSNTSRGSFRDTAGSFTQSESLAHHLESEAPSIRQAASIDQITSSALDSLSPIGIKPTVSVGGETEALLVVSTAYTYVGC
jgi:hypothetical protein